MQPDRTLEGVIQTRTLLTGGDRSAFFTSVQRGHFVLLFRGIYCEASSWKSMDRHQQYRLRVQAAIEAAGREAVVSHESAAALWRLPFVGEWPTRVHLVVCGASGGRSNSMFVRHTVGIPDDVVEIDGITVTSLARTVSDLITTLTFPQAVVIADAALRRATHPTRGVPATLITVDDMWTELRAVPLTHGVAKGARVLKFASGLADRPGESLSRVTMHLAGITPPELQVVLYGRSGRKYVVDFWWPEYNMIGEFDGKGKYTDPEFLRGRTPEKALEDEKFREDDLRAMKHGMSRWGWNVAVSPRLLRAHLIAAGIR